MPEFPDITAHVECLRRITVGHTNTAHRTAAPRMSRLLAMVALLCACGRPALPPEAARAEARRVWTDRCAVCHGVGGRGDGPGAKLLPVKPRDFVDEAWQASVDDAHIAKVIVDGGRSVGLDTNMAANPDLQSKPEVVDALVELVRGRE